MEIREIRKIVELIKENELTEFELEEEGFRISIKRKNGVEPQIVTQTHAPAGSVAVPGSSLPAAGDGSSPGENPGGALENGNSAGDEGMERITSPMIGTFYRSPAPDADSFIEVGSPVDTDTVVCIIEAMKVMNEITAEVKGTIRKILVENAAAVQFGQPLFQIDPS
jgi:acetyl-CoA carboxylase biotin carboxyl carrier protein